MRWWGAVKKMSKWVKPTRNKKQQSKMQAKLQAVHEKVQQL